VHQVASFLLAEGEACRVRLDYRLILTVRFSSPCLHRFVVAMFLLLPTQALAQGTLTLRAVNVRAGPDSAFPLVTTLRASTPLHVFGCVSGWHWCDVSYGRSRGWVHSSYIGNLFRDRTPIIEFSVETYWDAHYRRRSWYADRSRWLNWGTPAFRP